MNYASQKRQAVAALLLGAALLPLPGFAQATPPPANTPEEAEKTVELERFVVTGSNIPTTETAFDARTVPVLMLNRSNIEKSGFTTASELLQRMTVSNGGSVPISNNATGFTPAASSTSLRGLGPEATLVLINGRRVTPYPIGTGGTTAFVDLNTIPLAAIERVEVLKDGASANYGADAVAGVVNIILRDDYDGSEAMVRYGNTTEGRRLRGDRHLRHRHRQRQGQPDGRLQLPEPRSHL